MKTAYRTLSLLLTGFVFYELMKANTEETFHPYRMVLTIIAGAIILTLEWWIEERESRAGGPRTPDPNIPQRQEVASMRPISALYDAEGGRGGSDSASGL